MRRLKHDLPVALLYYIGHQYVEDTSLWDHSLYHVDDLPVFGCPLCCNFPFRLEDTVLDAHVLPMVLFPVFLGDNTMMFRNTITSEIDFEEYRFFYQQSSRVKLRMVNQDGDSQVRFDCVQDPPGFRLDTRAMRQHCRMLNLALGEHTFLQYFVYRPKAVSKLSHPSPTVYKNRPADVLDPYTWRPISTVHVSYLHSQVSIHVDSTAIFSIY